MQLREGRGRRYSFTSTGRGCRRRDFGLGRRNGRRSGAECGLRDGQLEVYVTEIKSINIVLILYYIASSDTIMLGYRQVDQ